VTDTDTTIDVWQAVVGQDEAVSRLRAAVQSPTHAYLLLGPTGVGTAQAALAFAAELLAVNSKDPGRTKRLAVAAKHADVLVVEPEGAGLRVGEAQTIIRSAQVSPVEGRRKVIIVHGVELIEEAAVGKLLKIIEEPPASTIFVLLASEIPPEVVTIASRCLTIAFGPLSPFVIEAQLVGEGVSPKRAKLAGSASAGDLDRARLLSGDDALVERVELWRSVPSRLNGRGNVVAELVSQLREGMDAAAEPLEVRHAAELEELAARVEALGERGSGRAELVARQKREVRKLRTDELTFGLATLARHYRDELVSADGPRRSRLHAQECLEHIAKATEAVVRNPNEVLLLQSLLLRLGAQ
jgi:DNA polymerase-3 subunit delta'